MNLGPARTFDPDGVIALGGIDIDFRRTTDAEIDVVAAANLLDLIKLFPLPGFALALPAAERLKVAIRSICAGNRIQCDILFEYSLSLSC